MSIRKRGKKYWYRFRWKGEVVEESTGQSNKEVARQMEAAYRTALAKGEVGIRDRKPVPTVKESAERHFLPFVRTRFIKKRKTRDYCTNGVGGLLSCEALSSSRLHEVDTEMQAIYAAKREAEGLEVSSISRELQVLRRMFNLAVEWKLAEGVQIPKVAMLPGEPRRERVLTPEDEDFYFAAARSEAMRDHDELVYDVASILIDCALRPEECNRLRQDYVRDGVLYIPWGKTENAPRRIPMTDRVKAVVEMRRMKSAGSGWLFPAATSSGHIEPSSLKKQQRKSYRGSHTAASERDGVRDSNLSRF